jgi:uncharacterized protein YacL
MLDQYQENRVTVTKIDIPFGSLVMFFTKAAIASIPAAILTTIIIVGVSFFMAIFGKAALVALGIAMN